MPSKLPPSALELFAKLQALKDSAAVSEAQSLAYKQAMRDVPYHLQPTMKDWLAAQSKGSDRSVLGAAILPSGQGLNELTKQYPELSGALEAALMGTPPDEMGSIMDPLTARRRKYAEPAYAVGIGAQVAPLIGPMARLAGKGAMIAGRAGEQLAERAIPKLMDQGGIPAQLLQDLAQGSQSNVIKSKGGNWLSGSVEDALKGLKREPSVGNIRGTELDNMIEQGLVLPAGRDQPAALNNWIDKQLTRYVKNEMATPEDPIRALAERGVTHTYIEPRLYGPHMNTVKARTNAGFPGEGYGKSDAAKAWEERADQSILPGTYATHTPFGTTTEEAFGQFAGNNPEAKAYGFNRGSTPEDLGFSHLIDELRNATNPTSGLPRELLLKYESLPQVSVPQAVERVSQINAWRAAQKAEADAAKANNAATVLHKDYPGRGFKWVELKKGEQVPEGWTTTTDRFGKEQWVTPEGKLQEVNQDPRIQQLEEALKYEGDTMGHCVGGYCPDVLEGRSRIFSLRSAKGEPHVTIEVKPKEPNPYNRWLAAQEDPQSYKEFTDWWAANTEPGKLGDMNPMFSKWAQEKGVVIPEDTPRIVQIKGKANRAPKPEYLPFVQDFVKSGKWSDVGDFHNTGLDRARERFNAQALKALEEQGRAVPEFATPAEIEDLRNFYSTLPPEARGVNPPEGFASGGVVTASQTGYNPQRVDELVTQLSAELFPQ